MQTNPIALFLAGISQGATLYFKRQHKAQTPDGKVESLLSSENLKLKKSPVCLRHVFIAKWIGQSIEAGLGEPIDEVTETDTGVPRKVQKVDENTHVEVKAEEEVGELTLDL
ncbi:hypothetical protein PCE1_004534 [Barthelona sp. PCE]